MRIRYSMIYIYFVNFYFFLISLDNIFYLLTYV